MDSDTLRARIEAGVRWRTTEYGRSLRQIADDLGLPASGNALLSKVMSGKPVSDATLRRLGRALGMLPPPRKRIQRTMTAAGQIPGALKKGKQWLIPRSAV